MSTHSEHSDSDSNNSTSWILLDNEKRAEEEKEDGEEPTKAFIELRNPVEEIATDSDGISIISDPDEGKTDSATEDTPKPEEVVSYKKHELVPSQPIFSRSSLTSAVFIIIGLLIALYFKDGYDDEVLSESNYKHYNPIKSKELIEPIHFKSIEYIPEYSNEPRKRKYYDNNEAYANKKPYDNKKNSKGYKEKEYKVNYKQDQDHRKKGEPRNYKNYNEKKRSKKYESSEEVIYNDHKYQKKEKKLREQEEFLIKKNHYLKNKEDKLKKKELKIVAKQDVQHKRFKHEKKPNKTGEWFDNMHNGRHKKRKEEQASNWMFERAQHRNKKRDKADWYFGWMEERETARIKKT